MTAAAVSPASLPKREFVLMKFVHVPLSDGRPHCNMPTLPWPAYTDSLAVSPKVPSSDWSENVLSRKSSGQLSSSTKRSPAQPASSSLSFKLLVTVRT